MRKLLILKDIPTPPPYRLIFGRLLPFPKHCKVNFGRSMIEMLGVLAIIGVLSAGGIMGYSAAMENYKVNKFIADVQHINVQLLFLIKKTDKIIDTAALCQIGAISDSYCKTLSGNYVQSPWKTNFRTYIGIVSNPILVPHFVLFGISDKTCVKILTSKGWHNDMGHSRTYTDKPYAYTYINGVHGGDILLPYSVPTAETKCKGMGSNANNSIRILVFMANH